MKRRETSHRCEGDPIESFRAETEYTDPGVSGIVTVNSAFEYRTEYIVHLVTRRGIFRRSTGQ